MSKLIKAPRLEKGAAIGLISNSSGMAAQLPVRVKRVQAALEALGFRVKIGRNALLNQGYTAGDGRQRAEDLHRFFKDPEIGAIMSFIGGNHSIHLLPYLDYQLIRRYPKILVGYSDTTVLELALYTRCGLVCFSGPAALTQFAEYPAPLPYTVDYFQRAATSGKPIGQVLPAREWTDELLDWFGKEWLKRPRRMRKNPGFSWLKKGRAQGRLVGGCLTSLLHLRGTPYWPDFRGKIFFWEIPEGNDLRSGEDVCNIDAYLHGLKLAGVFDKISAMIIGRPYGYTTEQKRALVRLTAEVTKEYRFPILMDLDFGHTDPMITLPLGVMAKLDSSSNSFQITECATRG